MMTNWLKNKIIQTLVILGLLGVAYGQVSREATTPYAIESREEVNKNSTTERVTLKSSRGGTAVTKVSALARGASVVVTINYYNDKGEKINSSSYEIKEIGVSAVGLGHSSSGTGTMEVLYTVNGRATYEGRIMSSEELEAYETQDEIFN